MITPFSQYWHIHSSTFQWRLMFLYAGLLGMLFQLHPAAQANKAGVESECHRLPTVVAGYLKTLDTHAVVRDDCLAILSDTRSYLPVLPQTLTANTPPTKMLKQFPEQSTAPDWVAFDNGYYLLRLIETTNGKLTLPRTESLPDEIKTGLIPQNFMVPKGFSVPSELRVLLGNLPYETPEARNPNDVEATNALSPLGNVSEGLSTQNTVIDPVMFTASLKDSSITAWDAISWKPKWSYKMPCLSTEGIATPTGEYFYAACLNSPKIEVMDVQSRQRRIELELPYKTQQLVQNTRYNVIMALHRYSNNITFIDSAYHLVKGELALPFPIQRLDIHPKLPLAYAISTGGHDVVEIDIQNRQILREFKLNAPKTYPPNELRNLGWIDSSKGRIGILWLGSSKEKTLVGIDLFNAALAHTLELPAPMQAFISLVPPNSLNVDAANQNPVLLLNDDASSYTQIQWENNTPKVGEFKTLIDAKTTKPFAWTQFSATSQANEIIGLDANSASAYRLLWNTETKGFELTPTPLIKELKSQVLTYIIEPTPKRLEELEAQQALMNAKPETTETLKLLRTQPKRQGFLSRLGEQLKFAPRDQ